MPWVLIILGIVLAALTLILRSHKEVTSTVTTSTSPASVTAPQATREPKVAHVPKPKPSSHAKSSSGSAPTASTPPAATNALRPASSTSTEQGLSDTLVGSLIGISAILILLGAFYSRISKFTVAGNTVELTPVTNPQEADQIASAVTETVIAELRDRGKLGDTMSTDQAKELAETIAAAAAQTQQQVAQVRGIATGLTIGARAGVPRVPQPPSPAVSLEADQVSELVSGMPFPDDLLSRLAERAVKEKVDLEKNRGD